MRHFTPERWNDFVRGLVSVPEDRAMRAHLDGGCGRCGRAVAAAEALQRLAAADKESVPLTGDVRIAKAIFCLDHPRQAPASSALRLIFDSRHAPVAGMRSGVPAAERNLAYGSDTVALSLSMTAADEIVEVAGGLTRPRGGPIAGVPVALLCREDLLAQALSDRQGEFLLAAAPAAPLTLRLLFDGPELVEAELPPPTG